MTASAGDPTYNTLLNCRCFLRLMHRPCGAASDKRQLSMISLYKSLIISSRILNALPLVKLTGPQWGSMQRLHRVTLRFCFGIPSFANDTATLTEVHGMPIQDYVEVRGLFHLESKKRMASITCIFRHLLTRKWSHLGQVAERFWEQITSPSSLSDFIPPHANNSLPLFRIPFLDFAENVLLNRAYVVDLLDNTFPDFVHVYVYWWLCQQMPSNCDGSLLYTCLWGPRGRQTELFTSIDTPKFCAVNVALDLRQHHMKPLNALILSDSGTALPRLQNGSRMSNDPVLP